MEKNSPNVFLCLELNWSILFHQNQFYLQKHPFLGFHRLRLPQPNRDEAAYVQGPLSFQAEFVQSSLDEAEATSWYLQGSYFLTGESRAYKTSSGIFSRVKPNNNYGPDGAGAIEVALRIQEMDLEEMLAGESAEAVSIGVNWHLNPNARVMFNLVNAAPSENSAYGNDVTSFVTRFAVNF